MEILAQIPLQKRTFCTAVGNVVGEWIPPVSPYRSCPRCGEVPHYVTFPGAAQLVSEAGAETQPLWSHKAPMMGNTHSRVPQ